MVEDRVFSVTLSESDGKWSAEVDGEHFALRANATGTRASVQVEENLFSIDTAQPALARFDGREVPYRILALKGVAGAADAEAGSYGPIAPTMTGKLDSILVQDGQEVAKGDVLFVLEAMKMRNEIKSPAHGVVSDIRAKPGQAVDTGTHILTLSPKS